MDRFDDVEFRILEEPERRRPRSRTRLASLATVTVAASLFATTAFATTDEPPTQTPAKASKFEKRGHHDCKRGERHRDSSENLGALY